jgi:hypothetical protein
MWAEFLGGWMPTSFSDQYCKETRRQWMSFRHGKPNDGGSFPLPGFLPDGARDSNAWRGNKEPIKATMAAWIAFLQEPSHFTSNGLMQAGVTGAPKLEDFQRRLSQAPAKP